MSRRSQLVAGRKKSELRKDLQQLASSWVKDLNTNPEMFNAATAILDVAAGFNSEVTDRLARADEKIRLGFIDWLGGKPAGAVAATLPAVFKLKSSATNPVLARGPLKLQTEAEGTTVHMEALEDTLLIPGPSPVVFAIDIQDDAFYRPFNELTSVTSKANAISSWRLKDFADTGDTVVYLEPPLGLQRDDFIKIANQLCRVVEVAADKVSIDPPLPAGSGFQRDTEVSAVRSFAPFDHYLNEQQHAVYLGDEELFNIPAATRIKILKLPTDSTAWSYWGKVGDNGPAWQSLGIGPDLTKQKGDVEIREINGIKSRWLRGIRKFQQGETPAYTPDEIEFILNPKIDISTSTNEDNISNDGTHCDITVFVNSTQTLSTDFQPLGRIPRQGDSLYIGCNEAFSKRGAEATLNFALADIGINRFAVLPSDASQNPALNAFVVTVSRNKQLQLFEMIYGKLWLRGDLLPTSLQKDSSGNFIDLSPDVAPVVWRSNDGKINILAAREKDVWHWSEGVGFSKLTELPRDTAAKPNDEKANNISSLGVYAKLGTTRVVCARSTTVYQLNLVGVAAWKHFPGFFGIVPTASNTAQSELTLVEVVPELVEGVPEVSWELVDFDDGASNSLDADINPNITSCVRSLEDANSVLADFVCSVKNSDTPRLQISPLSGGQGKGLDFPKNVDPGRTTLYILGATQDGASVVFKGRFKDTDNKYKDALFAWFPWSHTNKLFYLPLDGLVGGGDFQITVLSDQVLLPSARGGGIRGLSIAAPVVVGSDELQQLATGQVIWQNLYERDFTAPTIRGEYWNGSTWHPIAPFNDGTLNLATSGKISFDVPKDLTPTTWMGLTLHWIALRLTGGSYGEEVVTVTTNTAGSIQTQSVKTDISGIKPPFAKSLTVSYASKEPDPNNSDGKSEGWRPTCLLTQDSGNVRNQSEANATSGVKTEIFSPLVYGLREYIQPRVSTIHLADAECGCHRCNEQRDENNAPTFENQLRAIYIGIAQNISGGPVRFFIEVATEKTFADCGALVAEALVEGRYVACSVKDETFCLGESGMITLAIPEAPTPTELFGQPKCWIRLRPENNAKQWRPDIKRLLANAAWLVTGETVTDEPLGTSDGSINQKLRLSRTPLFARSLDLRVHEHLSSEDRVALTAKDSTAVVADPSDQQKLWVRWTEVDDTLDYGPRDRVYSVDETTGVIQFGDGRHGSIPPTTFGGIRAARYRRWEPALSGAFAGNAVAEATPLNLVSAVNTVEEVFAARASGGGTAGQNLKDFVGHFGNHVRHQGRALSSHDNEQLILSRFPQIAQARCVARNCDIHLFVVAPESGLSLQLAREIRKTLESNSLLQAARSIRFLVTEATDLKLTLSMTVLIPDMLKAGRVAERLKTDLHAFFNPRLGGRKKTGWPLGVSPNVADILAVAAHANPDCSVTKCVMMQKVALTTIDWPTKIAVSQIVRLDADDITILTILEGDEQ